MESSQLEYENWETFGQNPSMNHKFNMLVDITEAQNTPFFLQGQYEYYYCLLDGGMTYGRFKFNT